MGSAEGISLNGTGPASANTSGVATLPQQYWHYARYWEWLGYPAFVAMVAVYWLMVFKPAL
ncbi:DUF2269 family protein [Paraburkholderia bryophila]|uniref:DUF2269 family protein n=1 Tax=Paraburkholderia bryophila TaxID=420952 RepID=UPI0038BCAAC0